MPKISRLVRSSQFAVSRIVFRNQRKGFTLIELLIAISIVAIIASIGFVTYSQAQKVARDARRKQDLRAIAAALELYYQKNNYFPCNQDPVNTAIWQFSLNTSNSWIKDYCTTTPTDLVGDYINQLPKDPKGADSNVFSASSNYGYGYYGFKDATGTGCPVAKGPYYSLVTRLENTDDPEVHTKKQYKDCNGVTFNLTGAYADLYYVTSY